MSIRRLDTNARMSQAAITNDTVYLAGQVSKDPAGDVYGQTVAVLKQIDDLLARAGSSKEKILSATIYLADMSRFADLNKAWEAWVAPGHAPARTTVNAQMVAPDYLVEITVVAAK